MQMKRFCVDFSPTPEKMCPIEAVRRVQELSLFVAGRRGAASLYLKMGIIWIHSGSLSKSGINLVYMLIHIFEIIFVIFGWIVTNS